MTRDFGAFAARDDFVEGDAPRHDDQRSAG